MLEQNDNKPQKCGQHYPWQYTFFTKCHSMVFKKQDWQHCFQMSKHKQTLIVDSGKIYYADVVCFNDVLVNKSLDASTKW